MPPKASGGAGSSTAAANATARRGGQPGGILKKAAATASTGGTANQNSGGSQGEGRNKVVVRRCPPELPEAVFWQSVEPWIKDDAADWKLYKQGRSRKHGSNKESVNSVAYIHFKKQEQVTSFAAAYQGHTFRDSKGNRFTVVVQYAPFQKTPPKKVKPDPLADTIDDDAEYQAFVKSLTEPEEPKVEAPEPAAGTKGLKKTTPLLEELRRKKEENARKKAEGAKQSRTAKRAAARAAASGSIPGNTGAAGTGSGGGKATAADAKAAKKAERSKRKKDKKADKEAIGPPTTISGSQPGAAKPAAQKAIKATGGKQKASAAVTQKPKQPEAPPKMTILAPPKPANAAREKKEEQPKSTLSASSSVPSAAAPTPAPANAGKDQSTKPKPSLSSFDDIVGQFAKQMQSAPIKKPATKAPADKAKQPVNGEKVVTGPKIVNNKPSRAAGSSGPSTPAALTEALPPQAQAQPPTSSEAGRGRGRGRGGQPGRGAGRKASSTGREGPLSPNIAQATPAPT